MSGEANEKKEVTIKEAIKLAEKYANEYLSDTWGTPRLEEIKSERGDFLITVSFHADTITSAFMHVQPERRRLREYKVVKISTYGDLISITNRGD